MKSAFVGIVAVAALGSALATGAVLAAEGPGRALVASNNVQIAVNGVQSATGSNVGRSFIPPYSGTVRVKWDIKSKNGTLVIGQADVSHLSNCQAETASTGYVTQSCDLRVAGGMPLNISAFAIDSNNTVYLRNVSVSYKIVDFDGKSILWELPPQA